MIFSVAGKNEADHARKLKGEAEKSRSILKDRLKATEEELARTKVKLEKAMRDVSALDQRLGRSLDESAGLRNRVGMQVCICAQGRMQLGIKSISLQISLSRAQIVWHCIILG